MSAPAEIQGRATAGPSGFLFELKAVPTTPTHCRGRGCGVLLEPLRRYAGLCKLCVAKQGKRAARARKAQMQLKILREFMRHGEKHIEVECSCGHRRVMRLSTYNTQRPQCCKGCRLRKAAALRTAAREAHIATRTKQRER